MIEPILMSILAVCSPIKANFFYSINIQVPGLPAIAGPGRFLY